MAKQADTKQAEVKPVVPADAVGRVTVETEQPDGDVTVKTVPASEVKQSTAAQPQTATRTPARRQRKATPTVQRRSRDQRTTTRQRAARPLRDTTPQDRTVTISLPAHQWERMDRLIKRTQRSEGDFFRHLLSPYLR